MSSTYSPDMRHLGANSIQSFSIHRHLRNHVSRSKGQPAATKKSTSERYGFSIPEECW